MQEQRRNPREIEKLKDVIGTVFGVDIYSNARTIPHPTARAVFSKILFSKGYSLTEIGGFLNKSHATIIHYNRQIEAWLEHNQSLRIKYQEVVESLIGEPDPIHTLPIFELKKQIISLRKQNKKLYLDNSKILYSCNEDKRYSDVLQLIKDRIGSGDIDELKNFLKKYFNGVHK